MGSSCSTRDSSSAHAKPTYEATPCHWPQYEVFTPLKGFEYAQNWCQYNWPQPATTTTCTVDKTHPSPTAIQPPKAQKPSGACPNHSSLCRLFEEVRAYEGGLERDFAMGIWFVMACCSITLDVIFADSADSSCIENTPTVAFAALVMENDG